MGGVVKTITKPFKEIGEEVVKVTKNVVREVAEVPSEVIEFAAPIAGQTVEAATGAVGQVVQPVTRFISSPEGAATAGIVGSAFGVPALGAASQFLNRKDTTPVTTAKVQSLPPTVRNASPTQAVPQIQTTNDFSNLLLPIGGGILLLILLTRKGK